MAEPRLSLCEAAIGLSCGPRTQGIPTLPARTPRTALTFTTFLAMVATPLALGFTAPASASVSSKISTFPYAQDWSGLTATSTWADFPGVEGYNPGASIAASNQPNSTDVGTLTAEGTLTSQLVVQSSTSLPNTVSTGGVLAFASVPEASKTVALSATGTITTPLLVFHLDTTGESGIGVEYDIQDLDSGTDDQPTRVALQYRVGTSGPYTNVPSAYVTDATGVSNATVTSTHVSASLPPAVDGQADVFLRVLTLDNASGSNEHVGIDNISVTTGNGSEPQPLAATDPSDKAVYVNRPLTEFDLAATGGTAPYTWSAVGSPHIPAGITIADDGTVSGTPTETGTFTITATVTDDVGATADVQFDIVVSELPVMPLKTIPEIQGTGATSPLAGQDVSVQGVVTARYPDGGINGFVIQTAGYDPATDTTADASDGLFVYQGSSPSYSPPAIGEHVTLLSARVSEFSGATQVTVTNPDFVETRAASSEEAVTAGTVIPGADCVQGACPDAAGINTLREAHEHEAFQPVGVHTVTDSYSGGVGSSSMRGEFKIAMHSDEPLYIPLQLAKPTETQKLAEIAAFNAAHGVVLDDGATVSYGGSPAYPWLTLDNTVRSGASTTFVQPVVLDWRFGSWRLQPSTRIPSGNDGSAWVAFEQDRPADHADVLKGQGNLEIATFNMLNYFSHSAEDWEKGEPAAEVAELGTDRDCTFYSQAGGQGAAPTYPGRVSANECTWTDPRTEPATVDAGGPRGAAQRCFCDDLTDPLADFERQEAKEVAAINTMASDVVGLEEVENPTKIGYADRDSVLKQLVSALNADWADRTGQDTAADPRWAYVPSPRAGAQPALAEQDVIRNAFIYNPRAVALVGTSEIALNYPEFRNAREPLAQRFRHVDGTDADAFWVIVNHFKSKGGPPSPFPPATGDNADTGNGAGSYNGDRIRQAKALDTFAKTLVDENGTEPVFLTGDLNAYAQEDPLLALHERGWEELEPENGETSYFYGGLAGSLDHVLANEAALAMVTGQTVWSINANEPVYYLFNRYLYNATLLYEAGPFAASDHNPEIFGIEAPITTTTPDPVETVQLLASNDFHGRLVNDEAGVAAGVASMAGAVKEQKADNPNTIFAMAGDIIGASTFESFIQNDLPTIDALNEAGLDVSSAGNHEFDKGYNDFVGRVMNPDHPEGGADWPYIAANVRLGSETGPHALDPAEIGHGDEHSNGASWWTTLPDGRTMGFVGAVTEDLPSLVAPSAIEGLAITSVVDEVNAEATRLKTDGCAGQPCDLVIELVHEGAPAANCTTIASETTSTFGRIVHEANEDIDAIVSGHTHLKYNCKVEVAGWAGDEVTMRPVVSAGQYGANLNRLRFDFEPGTDNLVAIRQGVMNLKNFDEDAATKTIVDAAVAEAEVLGNVELGEVEGPFKRARRVDDITGDIVENRGGESTLGNQVAEIQRWKTGADIGVMNPGGLRDDLIGTGDGPGPVTYREAANVQPFANTLVTTELTGAQLKLLLEQQWQRDPDGNIPSRPFLRLGTSKGFTWTEDSSRAEGDRITGMWLNGVAVDATETYTVSANSFVASGGDNFRAFTLGTGKQDTGFTDLQATVDYLEAFASSAPLAVDHRQHAVGARVQGGPFAAGDLVTIPVDSLSMTGAGDLADTSVLVSLAEAPLGSFPVTTDLPTTPFDTPGAASVSFDLPAGLSGGTQWVTLTGATTGTVAQVPVSVIDTRVDSTVSGTAADITSGEAGSVDVTVAPTTATGTVELHQGQVKLGEGTLAAGTTTIAIPADALAVGTHTLTLKYLGDDDVKPSDGTVSVTIKEKPTPQPTATTVTGTDTTVQWAKAGSVAVSVAPAAATGTVELYDGTTKLGGATLSGGSASIALAAKALEVGSHTLVVKYLGSPTHAPSQGTVTVTVTKARPKVVVEKPEAIDVGEKAKVKVEVGTDGYDASGKVDIVLKKIGGTFKVEVTRTVEDGTLVARIEVPKQGRYRVKVTYLGDEHTLRDGDNTYLWVNRR